MKAWFGELLNSFKEIIKDGLCWFPRLMRWQTSKGEVSPMFEDNRNESYYYRLKSSYKAGIPKRTDIAGKPYRHNRVVSAEGGGCRKAGTAYGCKNEPESYALNLADIIQRTKLKIL